MDIAGVEHGDGDDRTDVVDDGHRGEEDAQLDGDAGTLTAIKAIANAVSVAIGTSHLCDHGPAGVTSAYRSAGTTMPPSAAAIGSRRHGGCESPTVISRFTFEPTTRKNAVRRPSLTQ